MRDLPRAPACKSLKGPDGHHLLPIILDVLSPWSFESLPIPFLRWTSRETCSLASHAAPESNTTVTFFHVHCSQHFVGRSDSVPQTLAHLHHLQRGGGMLAVDQPPAPSSDPVSPGRAPFSFIVGRLQTRKFFCLFLLQAHSPTCSSSSSMLLAHLYGQFTPICPCSPQS